jgi:hypothetical protein
MRFFKFHWDNTRGDAYDLWGGSWWYFEVDSDGWAVRQIEKYDNDGVTLKYDTSHEEDKFGGLAKIKLKAEDYREFEIKEIEETEFERVWTNGNALNRNA